MHGRMLGTFYVTSHKFDWKRKEKKVEDWEREEEKLFSHLRDEFGGEGEEVHQCVGMQCMDLYEEIYDSA
jgi:hypothetical protein